MATRSDIRFLRNEFARRAKARKKLRCLLSGSTRLAGVVLQTACSTLNDRAARRSIGELITNEVRTALGYSEQPKRPRRVRRP
jgi:hypothetical protein